MSSNHVINEVELNVSLPEEKNAMNHGNQMANDFVRKTLPEINEIFDEVCPPDLVMEIGELTIDIDADFEGNFEEEVRLKISKALKDKIKETIVASANNNFDTNVEVKNEKGDKVKLAKRTKTNKRKEELVWEYLQTGVLPFWVDSEAKKTFNKDATEFIAKNRNFIIEQLKNKPSLKSLLRVLKVLHSEKGMNKVKSVFFKKYFNVKIQRVFDLIDNLSNSTGTQKADAKLKHLVFELVQREKIKVEAQELEIHVMRLMKMIAQEDISSLSEPLILEEEVVSEPRKVLKIIEENLPNLAKFVRDTELEETIQQKFILKLVEDEIIQVKPFIQSEEEAVQKKKSETRKSEEEKTKIKQRLKQILEEQKRKKEDAADEESFEQKKKKFESKTLKEEKKKNRALEELVDEGLYINNAGMCILSPYLVPFLKNVGLAEGKVLKDPERACLLLQYLVTGEKEFEEHDLIFNKLLCGLDLDEPVELSIEPTPTEVEDCEGLLTSVIANWKALNGSSIDGLRESFFKREAVLTFKEPDWGLQIERTGLDVLVDGIEWGFSMIRMPWNEFFIYVDW